MGQVYKAVDVRLGRWVSLKFLSQSLVNEQMCARFETEARIAAQLCQQSEHIISVTDYGVDRRNTPFYVMEYLWGNNLKDVLTTAPLSLPRFLHLIRQICWGLQVAHQGILVESQPELVPIVHRDIKPGNIFVCPNKESGELAKILDFGISEMLRPDGEALAGYLGTPPYSPPEQLGGEPLDPRSDIYSLGVMMFEMLTQALPIRVVGRRSSVPAWYQAHTEQTPLSLSSASQTALPRSLTDLIMACLAKQPGDRPQSVGQMLRVLEPLCVQYSWEPSSCPSYSPAQPTATEPPTLHWQMHSPEPPPPPPPEDLNQPVWDAALPIQRIVVPRTVSTPGSSLPALWIMLPHREIRNLQISSFYNHIFKHQLFCQSPHPMILWITALINEHQGNRWFPAFLDMKSPQGNAMVQALIQHRSYQMLFFDLEPPHFFTHCIETQLTLEQYIAFQQWLLTSRALPNPGNPASSQMLLRQAYQKLRQQVEARRAA